VEWFALPRTVPPPRTPRPVSSWFLEACFLSHLDPPLSASALHPFCRQAARLLAAGQQVTKTERALQTALAATSAAERQREEVSAALLACEGRLRDAEAGTAKVHSELAACQEQAHAHSTARLQAEDTGRRRPRWSVPLMM
jgi:predicted HD phosphohydrolase